MPSLEIIGSLIKKIIGLKFIVWLAFFLMITTINWEYRYQAPIWDTAGGLFAPAEYLYKTNFDLLALLKEDGFPEGGPNVHVYNVVTFITALDMWIFDGDRDLIYISLHVLQFAISALLLYSIFYLALPIFGPINSILMSIAVFAFPPFLVQTRYMYVELTGAAFLFFAYSSWVRGNYITACIMAIVACAVKSFGLALIVALVILFCLDKGRSIKHRAIFVTVMLFSALSIEALRWSQGTNMATKTTVDFSYYFFNSFVSRLKYTPDLFILMSVALYGGVFLTVTRKIDWRSSFFNTNQVLGVSDTIQRMLVGGVLVIGAFVGFIITVPLTGTLIFPLTRYYMWIWPLVIPTLFCLIFFLSNNFHHPKNNIKPLASAYSGIALILFIIFFVANNSGKYYPGYQTGISAFSVVERSTEYESFNKMQRHLLHSASKIDNTPIYLNLFDYYFTSSILMGYLDKKNENFKNIVTSFDNSSDLSLYPDSFILVYSNVGHGGSSMLKLISKASDLRQYQVKIIDSFSLNGFDGFIYRITRKKT